MTNIIDSIQLSGTVYTIQGSGGTVSSAITSGDTNAVAGGAVYDKFDEVEQVTARALNSLSEADEVTARALIDLNDKIGSGGGITSGEVQTMINESVSGKVNTSSVVSSVTSASTDSEIPTAKAVYDAIPTGGTSYSAGRGISIDTADTISVSLPISAGTGNDSIIECDSENEANGNYSHAEGEYTQARGTSSHAEGNSTIAYGYASHAEGEYTQANQDHSHAEGYNTEANGEDSHAEGYYTIARGTSSHAEGSTTEANGYCSHAEGYFTIASGDSSHAEGYETRTKNDSEHASGQYNNSVSASTTFGNSGNTLFSVGNGTAENARHNAFEIRQNGDIYITSGGTDIKLQDNLGSTIEVSSAITSGDTNPVQGGAIYDKFDEVEQVTARALNALSEADEVTARALIDLNTKIEESSGGGITSGEVQTMINESVSGKVNTSSVVSAVTSASTDSEIPTAKAVYDAIPTGGTGGGKAIEAGRGISVTTGATADTVSFNLPISAGTGVNSVLIGYSSSDNYWMPKATAKGAIAAGAAVSAMSECSFAFGYMSKTTGSNLRKNSFAHGYNSIANGSNSHAEGYETRTNNYAEHANGHYNVSSSASTTFGDSGNTLFSVGNGTAENARHNAFEIRQNGDIYITSGGTDIKLQDNLGGGGGGSITIDPTLDSGSTNPVANSAITTAIDTKADTTAVTQTISEAVSGKVDTSAVTSAITSSSTDAQVPSAKCVYDQFDGMRLLKITQSDYDALSGNTDSSTLYVIVN